MLAMHVLNLVSLPKTRKKGEAHHRKKYTRAYPTVYPLANGRFPFYPEHACRRRKDLLPPAGVCVCVYYVRNASEISDYIDVNEWVIRKQLNHNRCISEYEELNGSKALVFILVAT